ncbi:MAG TPA: hypothetical protein VFY18_03685 [Candidatus Limnocylindrales bacterium]|nr:hypothetical protein [Candidatus Limnocylindrales bacterium]
MAQRSALTDFYFHSWRLLPANILWAVVTLAIVGLAILVPPLIVLAPLAALPVAGIFRIATRIVRGESVSFWDGLSAWQSEMRPALALGTGLLGATIVLGFNFVSGILSDSLAGWAFATLAFWGLVGTWLFTWVAWPILLDPERARQPVRDRLRLAALLLIAHPARVGGLGLVLAVLLVVSTVAVVALVSVSVSFSALVAARYVLPAADRLESGLAQQTDRSL